MELAHDSALLEERRLRELLFFVAHRYWAVVVEAADLLGLFLSAANCLMMNSTRPRHHRFLPRYLCCARHRCIPILCKFFKINQDKLNYIKK